MRVEADLFSGHPNPAWVASREEAARIELLLAGLRATGTPGPERDGLGYRGMKVSGVASHLHGCDELRIAFGSIVAECPDGRRGFHDPGRVLERLLVELAAAHLPPELHDVLRSLASFG